MIVPVGLLVVALIVAMGQITHDPDRQPLDPNPSSSLRIVALGDSYISGEGAPPYAIGTDVPGVNMCHRARTAYPYLLAERTGASLTFIACSGAKTAEVTGVDADGNRVRGQYPRSPSEVPGARPQVEALREVAEPDVVLISIGGNDAGFVEIGTKCATPLFPDCLRLAQHWLDRLETDVYPSLVRTYADVRRAARGGAVFALDYPNPIGPEFCRDLAGLGPAEMTFLREVFVGRLDEIVAAAARVSGVRVIDLSDALRGYRFCEKPLGHTAINFIALERTRGAPIDVAHLGGLAHGSLHPNRLGHELIEKVVSRRVEAVLAGHGGPDPQPRPDHGPPPFVPEEIGSPGGPIPFPAGTDCGDRGAQIAMIAQLAADPDTGEVELTGLAPRSTVCFRTYRAEWESKRARADGSTAVPIDVDRPGIAGINEILVEEPGGAWKKLVVSRTGAADVG